jgi:hypothetical protein
MPLRNPLKIQSLYMRYTRKSITRSALPYPKQNDGTTVHSLTVKNVSVDGFWSVSVYDAKGYFKKNDLDAYSVNNFTAKSNPDGSFTIRFGGCQKGMFNCLPIQRGWNYNGAPVSSAKGNPGRKVDVSGGAALDPC